MHRPTILRRRVGRHHARLGPLMAAEHDVRLSWAERVRRDPSLPFLAGVAAGMLLALIAKGWR